MLIHTPQALGLAIRDRRKARELTQTQMSELVNIKQETLSQFENKPEKAQIETLFKILSAANLELHLIPKGESGPGMPWEEAW